MMVNNSIYNTDCQLIQTENYDKKLCKAGIVHIGVGAFHRSHQAYYIHRLLAKNYRNWGIIGINLLEADSKQFCQLSHRDNNYILKQISPNGTAEYQEITSILQTLDWTNNPEIAEKILTNENIQLITLTISESGYYLNSDSQLNLTHPVFQQQLGKKTHIYAFLKQALSYRKQINGLPITILCCDNIINNGVVLEKAFKKYLRSLKEFQLLDWVNQSVSFPSSMVDRITPKPHISLSQETWELFSLQNDQTVLAESYIQWAIEDKFLGEKPPLDKVGVNFVKKIESYEQLKVRMLNGGHSCLAYKAALAGYDYFDKIMLDKTFKDYFISVQQQEIIPTLRHFFSLTELNQYLNQIIFRFSNAYIADKMERICMDGYNKIRLFLLPTIRHNFEQNKLPELLIECIAYWYIFMSQIISGSFKFNYIDSNWQTLKVLIESNNIQQFTRNKELWGEIPENHSLFSTELSKSIIKLQRRL